MRRETFFAAVALLVLASGALADDEPGCPKRATCAMTNVLVNMNELLRVLTSEIQDLRSQVRDSCQAKEKAPWDYSEEEPIADDEADEMLEKVNVTLSTEVEPDYEDADTETDYEEEEEEGEEDEDEEDTGDGLFGNGTYVTSIINSLTIFEPLPDGETVPESNSSDTTTAKPMTTKPTSTPPPVITTSTTPTTSTTTTRATTTTLPPTTTKEPDHNIPPIPTSCPTPFTLIAKGCYLIVSDTRHWSSWGRAHAFCQQYNGGLAQPYRFGALQKYLSRHYSDTFWVGVHRPGTKFLWLNNRKVGRKVWKEGQPSKHPNKNCVYLDRWSGYQATNHFCGEKYPFICEASEMQL
ncbi:uncharacterized protein [Penaeus vannamei]|uniref:uncharacterized protein n=1 Tax=Penaeus vannamei TaxID=6689 RepID=UPI00387F5FCB